ncbi:hypothetical protein MIMGU_mgv1a016241mg [Erythranthe guttata]|uniref:Uncharacterized protein n=1 Tax=Erythranthe guttata TaxID=4155 RepID=A0A022QIB8_ERYGU|nr:hypothetical protein MIMGU_mgv1a016241mg [Erythranthe guttata]
MLYKNEKKIKIKITNKKMAFKLSIFLVAVEFLLVAYILLDIYAAVFIGPYDIVSEPEDSVIGLNATNEDPKVVGLGMFAVDEYNKLTNSNLKFQSVVMDDTFSASKQYGAVVNRRGDRMSLLAFDEYNM